MDFIQLKTMHKVQTENTPSCWRPHLVKLCALEAVQVLHLEDDTRILHGREGQASQHHSTAVHVRKVQAFTYLVTGMKTASSPVLLSITTGVLGLYTQWQELKHILDTSSTLTTGGLGDTRNWFLCEWVCRWQHPVKHQPGADGHLILNSQPTAQVTPAQNASNRRQKWVQFK